jgi:hypothetical protein
MSKDSYSAIEKSLTMFYGVAICLLILLVLYITFGERLPYRLVEEYRSEIFIFTILAVLVNIIAFLLAAVIVPVLRRIGYIKW